LLSREQAAGRSPRDIADKTVIAVRVDAHRYARLYFRPKNPTQFHIEGIRKAGEFYRNDADTHAPVLVVMIFKAEDILTSPDVCFSDGNMQSPARTRVLSTDPEFRALPFDRIFHVGPIDRNSAEGAEVNRCRCAEVLVPSPLPLDERLQAVLCRSPAERATLLYLLGDQALKWAQRIRVFTEPGVFENRYAYVDEVSVSDTGVIFSMHPRFDARPVRVDIRISSIMNGWRRDFFLENASPSLRVSTAIRLPAGEYLVEIDIDGCCAYRAISLIDELPF
jgi:hypothetical protein